MSENKIISWQLPFTKQENATKTDDYLSALSQARDGFYPLGENQIWHGGIHLNDNVIKALGAPLGCIADGEVIAYRIDKQYQSVDYGDEIKATFSGGFVLVKHTLEIPQPPLTPTTTTETASSETAKTDNNDENAEAKSEESNGNTGATLESELKNSTNAESATSTDKPDNVVVQDNVTPAAKPEGDSQDNDSSSNVTATQTEDAAATTVEGNPDSSEAITDDSAESVPADAQSDEVAKTPPDSSTSTNTPSPTATLTLYSLYMHLSDWKSYQDNPKLVRPGYWLSNEYSVGNKAKDKIPGCVVRENGGGTKILAILPRGTQVRVGEPIKASSPWRKLIAIETGEAIPALTGDALPGYVYVNEMAPSPDDTALYTVADKGNDKAELALGLNVRDTPSSKGKWLNCLVRGSKLVISEKGGPKNQWGRIERITEGRACPELTKDEAGKLLGWVYLGELDAEPATPEKTDEVVALTAPYPIKTGQLIGYPGQYQKLSEAKAGIQPAPLTHFELFSCDDVPAIISQCRSQWQNCSDEHKVHTVINKGAALHTPAKPDRVVEAGVEIETVGDSKASGRWVEVRDKAKEYTLIIPRSQLGNYTTKSNTYKTDTPAHKQAIVNQLATQGNTVTTKDIPDSVTFTTLYYHDTDDNKFVNRKSKGYGRRQIRFTALQNGPLFWINSEALTEEGKRKELSEITNSWSQYALQKGQNALESKTGFNYIITNSEDKPATQQCSIKDGDGKGWHFVSCVDENGEAIEGWVNEDAPDVTCYSPWQWPLFELVTETATPQQQLDRMNRGVMLDEADRTPLMKALYKLIDIDNDNALTAAELRHALTKPWLASQISRLIVNYESEWFADEGLSKWNALDDLFKDRLKAYPQEEIDKTLALWQAEKQQRIKKLLWWDKLAGKHGLNKDGRAWYFHPVGMVGNFAVSIDESYNYYVDEDGFIQDAGIIRNQVTKLERGNIAGPNAIVLHRTYSRGGALNVIENTWKAAGNTQNVGAHFVIDKDGTIHQVVSLKKYANHVGQIRPRCELTNSCPAGYASKSYIEKHREEIKKAYPERYPYNGDSIGIEVVAWWDKDTKLWDDATPKQLVSIKKLVKILQKEFNLNDEDLYQHQCISYKTSGEGKDLYPPADNNGNIDPRNY